MSAIDSPISVGIPCGSPVTDMIPLKACNTMS
jgi:hypothetical protein